MKYLSGGLMILLVALSACTEKVSEKGAIAIIPKPDVVEPGEGFFTWDRDVTISVEGENQQSIARTFLDQFESVSGWRPAVEVGGQAEVRLKTDPSIANEAYELSVTGKGVSIKAGSDSGFFYAFQTLRQLFSPVFYGTQKPDIVWGLPEVSINDQPAFEWRGYMLDVSRHFFEVDQVKDVLDMMASLKMNRFHWHLTDDQGWRIEIKSYPKLTEIGAWRVDHNITDETISNWWGRPEQRPGEQATYGGFYTQEQVKEIIAYARERFIEVIPEIDMPGHAQATIAAYPEIGCVNAAPFVATGGVYRNNTYNPGKEETFEFAEKMLNEVMDLFPFDYVHIGGDECNKEQWKLDPFAQKRIRDEGLKDEFELQSYFIKRIEKIINVRGKRMIGWDEILEGGLAPNATVMSWRGEEGGLASVRKGHEVIMTPNSYCYIDLKQGHDDLEPNLGYSQLLLSKSYSYQVIPGDLTEEESQLIKGVQANLWTESISDWGKLTYMTFPRVYAIAETGWTPFANKDWDDFTSRLLVQFQRLDQQNIRYATSAFSPSIHHRGSAGQIEVTLSTEVNDLDIYYTLDGSVPTTASNFYSGPFTLQEDAIVKAQAFTSGKEIGNVSSLSFPVHKAAGLMVSEERSGKRQDLPKLTDLTYARLSISDTAYQDFSNEVILHLTFEAPTPVKEISFNALRFTISGVYSPEFVEVKGSDGEAPFSILGEQDAKASSHTQGRNKVPHVITFEEQEVRELQIKIVSPSEIPVGHHRAGQTSRMKIDEIVIR